MGLFSFNKRETQERKVSDYINSTFGYVAKNSYCLQINALNRVCSILDCPAHFAFVAVQDARPIGKYPTYTLKIVHGEINARDNCGMLNYILSCNEDKRIELLQNRFALSETEASAISGCGVQYGLDETSGSIVFFSDDVMKYLQCSDVTYHFRALGRIIHEEVPEAYVSVNAQMVFVMLNGNEKGTYLEEFK